MVSSRLERRAPAIFTGFAVVFVLLVLFKAFTSFDGIPYWDMYDGGLTFYARFSGGEGDLRGARP